LPLEGVSEYDEEVGLVEYVLDVVEDFGAVRVDDEIVGNAVEDERGVAEYDGYLVEADRGRILGEPTGELVFFF